MARKFIQKIKYKPGTLHRELKISKKSKIPMRLLRKIDRTKIGTKIKNPTHTGKRKIKVTRLLKRRAVLATTFKRLAKRRKAHKKRRKA